MAITKEEARTIATAINGALGQALDRLVRDRPPVPGSEKFTATPEPEKGNGQPADTPSNSGQDFERLYARIKRRLIDEARVDPVLLHLLTKSAPEIVVDIEPRRIDLDGSTLRGRLALLAAGGWFEQPRATAAVRKELARTGSDPGGGGNLASQLQAFVVDGFLTREGEQFQIAPGAKVTQNRLER